MEKIKTLRPKGCVAILSPSADTAGYFPHVYKRGEAAIKDLLGLDVKLYPTTLSTDNTPEKRAKDLNAAFEDKNVVAIFTTIGGDDEVRILKYLDKEIIRNNPKPFFGYSDNTHLNLFLSSLGVPCYYGASIMTQFAMAGGMDAYTVASIMNAINHVGEVEIKQPSYCKEADSDWSSEEGLKVEKEREKALKTQWISKQKSGEVKGELWGGCLECIFEYLASGNRLKLGDSDKIIFIETAEDMPTAVHVKSALQGMGERGIFKNAKALLVGRPKTLAFDKQISKNERIEYRKEQRKIIRDTFREYSDAPIIFNLSFGHTDPQLVVPYVHEARINLETKQIFFDY